MRVIGTCPAASAAVRSHDPRVSGRRGDLWVLQGRGKSRDTVIPWKDFFLAVMLSCDSALDWAFSPPGFSIWQFVPYAIQCVSGPGFLEEGHQNAKKHIEALEMAPKYKSFFISRTVVYAQSVCPNSWKVREKYSSSQVLRCPPFVQRNFIGEKAVHLWIEGTEVRRERSRASR